MRTETARVQDEAQMRSFKANGYEYVLWIYEPDACENCIDIANVNDGVYPIAKVPGIPVHANCRCSKVAYVPDKVEKLLIDARNAEPDITNDLIDISEKIGTSLVGMEYRLKGYDSLSRKVRKEVDAIMRDVVRYTSISTPNKLVSDYSKFVEEMKKKGYTQTSEKNSWIDKRNPYNGLNTNFKTPHGYEFEIQFHTKESFELKQGLLHSLYEKVSILDKSNKDNLELLDKLNKEMWKLSNQLKIPSGIDKIRGGI